MTFGRRRSTTIFMDNTCFLTCKEDDAVDVYWDDEWRRTRVQDIVTRDGFRIMIGVPSQDLNGPEFPGIAYIMCLYDTTLRFAA